MDAHAFLDIQLAQIADDLHFILTVQGDCLDLKKRAGLCNNLPSGQFSVLVAELPVHHHGRFLFDIQLWQPGISLIQ